MNILVVDNGTRFMDELQRLLSPHTVRVVTRYDLVLPLQYRHDLIVLSGGNQVRVIDGLQEYAVERELIRTSLTPILGICLGFQLIADGYGATLNEMAHLRKGLMTIQPTELHPLFAGLVKPRVYENHRWVIKKAPDEFEALAISEDGIEIVRHRTRPVYGFQFHPEIFAEESQGKTLFQNFLKCM